MFILEIDPLNFVAHFNHPAACLDSDWACLTLTTWILLQSAVHRTGL